MDKDSRNENVLELHALDFDEDFALIDAAICEYDAVGNAPQRKARAVFNGVRSKPPVSGFWRGRRIFVWRSGTCVPAWREEEWPDWRRASTCSPTS